MVQNNGLSDEDESDKDREGSAGKARDGGSPWFIGMEREAMAP